MKILIAGEFTGRIREAFKALGHEAWSCDLLASEIYGNHYQGDVLDILDEGWDLMIAHPPCRYLTNTAVQLLKKEAGRWEKMLKASDFFRKLWNAPIKRVAIENPIMHGYGKNIIGFKKFTQIIQPYDFGEDASKKTGLLLKNLPPLMSTLYVPPKLVKGRWLWGNQTWGGHKYFGPHADRAKNRSRTFPGIAHAMAAQWGQ